MNNETIVCPPHLSEEALAHLGDGQIAYIKTIRSGDVPAIFPQAPQIAPGLTLFALHAAPLCHAWAASLCRGSIYGFLYCLSLFPHQTQT